MGCILSESCFQKVLLVCLPQEYYLPSVIHAPLSSDPWVAENKLSACWTCLFLSVEWLAISPLFLKIIRIWQATSECGLLVLNMCVVILFSFWNSVSLSGPTSLRVLTLLPQPQRSWDFGHAPLQSALLALPRINKVFSMWSRGVLFHFLIPFFMTDLFRSWDFSFLCLGSIFSISQSSNNSSNHLHIQIARSHPSHSCPFMVVSCTQASSAVDGNPLGAWRQTHEKVT